MPTDQVITLPPDSTGKSVDMSQIVTSSGVTVERERVNLSDPDDPNAHVSVRGESGEGYASTRDRAALDVLLSIEAKLDHLIELFTEVLCK